MDTFKKLYVFSLLRYKNVLEFFQVIIVDEYPLPHMNNMYILHPDLQ